MITPVEIVLGLVAGASLGGVVVLANQLQSLKEKRFEDMSFLQTNLTLAEAKIEHLYHYVLASSRMQLINPETLKKNLSERKKNYDFAKQVFGEDKKIN
jgi:esterase/lipase